MRGTWERSSGAQGQQNKTHLTPTLSESGKRHISEFIVIKSRKRITAQYPEKLKMSKIHRNPPFRAEHLGSLLRPKDFLQKRAAFENKQLSQEELTKAENEAISKVVKVQTDAGFHGVSDGEYRWV